MKITGSKASHAAAWFLASLAAATAAWPADLTIPNSFQPGTPATAASVNANFAATATAVNSKQNQVLESCPAGQAIKIVNQNGTVVCETFSGSNGTLNSAVAAVNRTVIFDSQDVTGASQTSRTAGSSPGALINVSADTPITRISVFNELTARGNLRFLIFSHPAHVPLLATNAQPFAADATGVSTWKDSVPINFTLQAGQSYDIGAISDVAGNWGFDTTADTAFNITSVSNNANFATFASPTVTGHAGADVFVRVWGVVP
jgi:hypothetical protein